MVYRKIDNPQKTVAEIKQKMPYIDKMAFK